MKEFHIIVEIRTKDLSGNKIDVEKVKEELEKSITDNWNCYSLIDSYESYEKSIFKLLYTIHAFCTGGQVICVVWAITRQNPFLFILSLLGFIFSFTNAYRLYKKI